MNIHLGYRKLKEYKGTSCGQHSALSTQHSASYWLRFLISTSLFSFGLAVNANAEVTCSSSGGRANGYTATASSPAAFFGAVKASVGLPWAGGCEEKNGYEEYDENLGSAFLETEQGILYHVSYRHLTGTCDGLIISQSSGNYPADERSVNCSKSSAVKPSTLIGYFNGVANTRATALISRDRLEREYGATYKSKPLEYELFYNQTTCELGAFYSGKIPCLEDIAEVFEQRSNELNNGLKNRWEHFWEMLSGRSRQDGSLTVTLTSKLGKFGENILRLLDNIYSLMINQFVGSLPMLLNSLNGTPTLADNAVHVAKLKTYADKGSGMILVAHSQGNLFVNAAYDGLKTAASAAKVKVVHVAPASPTLRGGYALADVDYVIRTLRQLVTGLPSVNIELPLSANDRTGHSFEGTYLDVSRKAYERVKTMINSALDGV